MLEERWNSCALNNNIKHAGLSANIAMMRQIKKKTSLKKKKRKVNHSLKYYTILAFTKIFIFH